MTAYIRLTHFNELPCTSITEFCRCRRPQDDVTDVVCSQQDLVELECKFWASKGKNVKYEVRNNRKGYKAGALKQGMLYDYVQQCDFVAVFDADFQPEPDFLMRTVPYLVHDPRVALVQARWEFGKHEKPQTMSCFINQHNNKMARTPSLKT